MKIEMRVAAMLPQAKKSQEPVKLEEAGKVSPLQPLRGGGGGRGDGECDSANTLISAFWPLEL